MLALFDLPQDILFAICAKLAPQDVVALKQTCRVLHAFTRSDYIWHQLAIDLPLDLLQDPRCNLSSLSGDTLHSAVVHALRLEHNWRKKEPAVRRLTRITHGTQIYHMEIFAQKWLLTLSRSYGVPDGSHLSVWRLPGANGGDARLITALDIALSRKFAVGVQSDGDRALIATMCTLSGHGHINLFNLSLKEDETRSVSDPDILRRLVTIPIPEHTGVLFDIHINGPIVVADFALIPGVSNATPDGLISFQTLVINADTNFKALIPSALPAEYNYDRMNTRLYPDYILTVGWKAQRLYVLANAFPPELLSPTVLPLVTLSSPTCKVLPSWGPTLSEYEVVKLLPNFDLYLSPEPELRDIKRFSSVLFDSRPVAHSKGEFFQLPLHFPAPEGKKTTLLKPTMSFSLPSHTTQDLVCLGKTGQRAVWFERNWDSDDEEYRLMRASLPVSGEKPVVGILLPKHMALPFELHMCKTIYFEEATCRVCFGLHTGDVYVMEF